jgi:cysteine synthase A
MESNLKKKYQNLANLVGTTPLVKISDRVYGKLETYNPSGSIKDRMIAYLLGSALECGEITSETILVEATSGNTGISLSMFGAALGLKVLIVMPSNMSEERKQMMRAYGAEIIDAPPSDFTAAISLREEICKSNSNAWSPMQFENTENIDCHRYVTGPEIHDQVLKIGEWSAFVSGAGTGGTMSGISKFISKHSPNTKTVLMVPEESAKLHGIQGVNDGEDFLLDKDTIDVQIAVSTKEAIQCARRIAKDHGLLVGISSGANVLAAEQFVAKNNPAGVVITMLCDRGERDMTIFSENESI